MTETSIQHIGRQPYTDIDYQNWLNDMAPFLKLGATLNAAIEDAGLTKHRTALYEKFRLNDDFSHKIKAFQERPGKLANYILVKRIMQVDEKIKQGLPVSEEEMKDVRFIAEKHRSSQPYFVNRTETTQARPIEELLDELEGHEDDNFDDSIEKIKEIKEENR